MDSELFTAVTIPSFVCVKFQCKLDEWRSVARKLLAIAELNSMTIKNFPESVSFVAWFDAPMSLLKITTLGSLSDLMTLPPPSADTHTLSTPGAPSNMSLKRSRPVTSKSRTEHSQLKDSHSLQQVRGKHSQILSESGAPIRSASVNLARLQQIEDDEVVTTQELSSDSDME